MKKIIFCISNDILYDRRILRCAETLSKTYEVEILCRRIHQEEYDNHAFSAIRMRCFFNKGFLFYFELNFRLLLKLLVTNVDYIVAVDYDTILAASISTRTRGKKLVFDAHEYFEESIELVNRPVIKGFWKRIGKFGIKNAKLAYTVSESIACEYASTHGLPFQCIRNVPKLSSLANIRHEKKVILYQGMLNQGRQLELLIDTAAYLGDEYQIWIIGEGDIADELRNRAQSLDSKCDVIFHSWVHPEELSMYTAKAYLAYNLLEKTSKSYYWSLANKFFDYVHAGVVSINSKFPEYVKVNEAYNCCLIVDFSSAEELAKYILDLVEQQELMSLIKRNCLTAAEELCWEKESLKLIELFSSMEESHET